MPSYPSLLAELLRFVRASSDSPRKEHLLRKVDYFRRQRRGFTTEAASAPDRLPGIVAAISYIMDRGGNISAEEFRLSTDQRNTQLSS